MFPGSTIASPPQLSTTELLFGIIFICGSRKGGLEWGPDGGGDQNQMCSFDRYPETHFMGTCFLSRGFFFPETAFFFFSLL